MLKFRNLNFLKFHQFSEKLKTKAKESQMILLFDHSTPRRYYLINSIALIGYSLFAGHVLLDSSYPMYFKRTIGMFSSISVLGLVGMVLLSRRHVKSISLDRRNRKLSLEVYTTLARSTKSKEIDIKNISHISPLSSYIRLRNTGVYVISFKTKEFNSFNKLIMRPINFQNKREFEEIFKPLIRKF